MQAVGEHSTGIDLIDPLLDPADDLLGISAGDHHDHRPDRLGRTVLDYGTNPNLSAELNVSDLSQKNRDAVGGADHNPLKVFEGMNQAQAPNQELFGVLG